MAKDEDSSANVTRRGLVLMGAQLALIAGLGWRMRHLQVEEGERYRLLAEENRVNEHLIAPSRGLIFDRQGHLIAVNQQNYRVLMSRERGNPADTLMQLSRIIDLSPERRARILRELYDRRAFQKVTVAEHMSWEDFARVAANSPALPGVETEVGLSRHYPEAGTFAHLVGYVGPVSDYDLSQLENPDPLLREVPDFQIGKNGIERRLEDNLRGSAGISRVEINASGRIIRELERVEGRSGEDLQLTVDSGLQDYAQRRMEGESAATVVMDVQSGDLVAMASAPSFDPNNFVFGISTGDWRALNEDEYRPLYNKAVSGVYPPGSTFKMVVALAAMELGLVNPNETVFCGGSIMVGNRRAHCWRRGGHGHMNLRDSLKSSCDIYYYDIAQRIGIDRISEMANRLGIGIRHDIPLPAVRAGNMPDREWKQRVHGEPWLIGDTVNSGIGQGFMLASPLELCVMTARLATGKAVSPRLVRSVNGVPQPAPEPEDLGFSAAGLAAVRGGMWAVSNDRRGTAYRSRIADPQMVMAGKTGTSQVRRITEAERRTGVFRNEDLPWNRRDHALFVAYAPFDNPRYAIATIVEHGGGGSRAAAPIAQDVMIRALYGPEPPLDAWPSARHQEIRERRRLGLDSASVQRDRA
ncbi:penicillin-binding protein 2 [Pontivivens insulae]|uniref:Peptidoglycan D,D-transpeptidase MrdA n=1 Tax=Pontivivens insulae TaxID=1639689 RepID=A0A2R8A7J0_9RHOB|nr:penicillin-binding protein 2 [Pontivivens insulae]RED18299.1 peptidoglycan glycosyltransferase [Pontivivens insulae]SPF28197.1 Peptidoglycan D,D-transpeptidase MrdA [Pontivivens insulae]